MATAPHNTNGLSLSHTEVARVRRAYALIDMVGASFTKMLNESSDPETAASQAQTNFQVAESCVRLLALAHCEMREIFRISMSLQDSLELATTGQTALDRILSDLDSDNDNK